jgi:hypothetical protein
MSRLSFCSVEKRLSILRSALLFVIGLVIVTEPLCAQTWTSHIVSPNSLESLTCLASSADGSTLVVGSGSADNSGGSLGQILISTNSGLSWQTTSAASNWWTAVACSADGAKIVAVNLGTNNPIYTSSDSGNTWIPQSSPITYGAYGAASSADGTKLVVFGTYGTGPIHTGIFLSSDSGVTWTLAGVSAGNPNLGWNAVASSADGTHLAATSGGTGLANYIYVSSDSGNTWTPANVFSEGWSAIASSADGSKIVAVGNGGIYTSDDYGATWQVQPGPSRSLTLWSAVASSADGNRLLIGTQQANVPLYSSFDAGLTWVSNNVPGLGCQALASSADGVKLAALPLNIGDVIGTVQLADIDVSLVATPSRVDLQDMIQVTLTITNESTNTISNVQVSGSLGISGAGGVSLADISGPAMIESLPPGTNATITYEYEATNYGFVTFSATVTGQESGRTIYSLPGYSGKVAIFPNCDLIVKANTVGGAGFQGAGEYQQSPSGDQNLRVSVGTGEAVSYTVRVQNDSSIAHTFLLTGATNSAWPDWNIQVTYDNANILDALTTPGSGWTTPSLDPGEYLDLQVSLAPAAGAELSGTQSVRFDALPDASDNYILDSVLVRAQLVAVPVQVAIQALNQEGLTPESISAGMNDIDAPLVPVTDPNVLAGQPTIDGGLVADGVTPLLVQLTADASALQQFPQGAQVSFQPTLVGSGTLNGDALPQRFQVLQNGAWQAATASTTVTLTSSENVAYFQLLPINSDDVMVNGDPPELTVDFSVVDTDGNQDGDLQFAIRKPPIALVHGYNTTGDWGLDFQTVLGFSRPWNDDPADNFIVTVKYGQDTLLQTPLQSDAHIPVYVNTVASLDNCAQMALESLRTNMVPLHDRWAFTRFDVVAHSQGGVLTRMLCNVNPNNYITQPFRNAGNFNRGRFHRVVTIGSPHNGTRLLRYLLDLEQEERLNKQVTWLSASTLPEIVGLVGVVSAIAQAKFDPWGPQIAELNNPSSSAPWQPDSAALFHLVRATIDNGASPALGDLTPSYLALDLCNATGGQTVLPRGSDGVVDYDSMAANVPPAGVGANVFTVDPDYDISHSAPQSVFNSSSYETVSPVIARHVIAALDQSSDVPPGIIIFSPFSLPPLLSSTIEEGIDNYAVSFVAQAINNLMRLPSKQDDQTNYQYEAIFPTNLPPESSVVWSVQVYGPDGLTSDGVELLPGGDNNSQVTVTVDGALVGDVVLSGIYASVSNTVVALSPVLVVSLPLSGPAMTGFQTLPGNIALSVGSAISPVFVANYSDGSTSARYVTADEINVTSSQPAVVSVSNALYWVLSSVGTSEITVSWSGFQAASQITVFDPASTNPPPLSLVNGGNGQLTVSWPGFTTSYQVQMSGDLSNTNSWQTMPTTPLMAGGESLITLSATNTQQFYRLQWQQ